MRKIFITLALLAGCHSQSTKLPEISADTIVTQENATEYKIRLEFYIAQEDVDEYPDLVQSFGWALEQWSEVLPIEALVFFDDIILSRPSVVTVDFSNAESDNILGVWFDKPNRIIFFTKHLIGHNQLTNAVCLHELGHLFGLPHILYPLDARAPAGSIIADNAETYFMFPQLDDDAPTKISALEQKIALNYVINILPYKLSDVIKCQNLTY